MVYTICLLSSYTIFLKKYFILFKYYVLVASHGPLPSLEKEYTECVARGEEPPFDLEDLLRRYGSSPPNPEVSAPPSSSAPVRNPSEHFAFPRKDG